MDINKLEDYAIEIEYRKDKDSKIDSSGVIFKPNIFSNYAYILTAKHAFFGDSSDNSELHTEYKEKYLTVDPNFIKINKYLKNLKILGNKIYFFQKSDIDLAFFIILLEHTEEKDSIRILSFFDFNNNELEYGNLFKAIGYPSGAKNNLKTTVSYSLKYESIANNENYYIRFQTNDPITTQKVTTHIQGYSGSGLFVSSKNYYYLTHIFNRFYEPNFFYGTQLDIFLDYINNIISETIGDQNLIQSNSSIIIEGEKLDFYEYGDLDFFKKRIINNLNGYKTTMKQESYTNIFKKIYNEDKFNLDDNIEINNFLPQLKTDVEQTVIAIKAYSYLYAYLAVQAHYQKRQHLSTSLFKKAISLNPEHQQTFLLEKQKRNDDKEALKTEAKESIANFLLIYPSLIENEQNITKKIILIKEALSNLSNLSDFNTKKENYINDLLQQLTDSYEKNLEIRPAYKYKKLTEYYYKYSSDSKTTYKYYLITNCLLDKLHNYTLSLIDSNLDEELSKLELDLSEVDRLEQQEKANKIARCIILNEENKDTKQKIKDIENVLYSITEEFKILNLNNNNKFDLISNTVKELKELNQSKTDEHNLLFANVEKSIETFDNLSNDLNQYFKELPNKYIINFDEELKSGINNIISKELQSTQDILNSIENRYKIFEKNLDHFENQLDFNRNLIDSHLKLFDQNLDANLKQINTLLNDSILNQPQKKEINQIINKAQEQISRELREIFLKKSENLAYQDIQLVKNEILEIHKKQHQYFITIANNILNLKSNLKLSEQNTQYIINSTNQSSVYNIHLNIIFATLTLFVITVFFFAVFMIFK